MTEFQRVSKIMKEDLGDTGSRTKHMDETPQNNSTMKTAKHTPAPWIITHDNGSAAEGAAQGLTVIVEYEDNERKNGEDGSRHIAFCFGDPGDDPQAVADYHLIATAPRMFKKLVEYAAAFPDQEALDIIAEAEGAPSVHSA